MFASFTDELRKEKKELPQLDTVQLMPYESPIKDVKVSPKKDDIREYNLSTYSDSEAVNNVPATLAYLDDYLDKRKNNDKSVEEKREEVESFLKKIIEKHELCMQVPEDAVSSIISEKLFKNTFETKTSNSVTRRFRKQLVSAAFGVPKDVVEDMLEKNQANQFEKYGYLGKKSSILSPGYGIVKFIFNKSSLLNRTTMTVGDSLRSKSTKGIIASKATDPKAESIPGVANGDDSFLEIIYKLIRDGEIREDMDPLTVAHKIFENDTDGIPKYIELQYHGKLSIDDVEVCELPTYAQEETRNNISKVKSIKLEEPSLI